MWDRRRRVFIALGNRMLLAWGQLASSPEISYYKEQQWKHQLKLNSRILANVPSPSTGMKKMKPSQMPILLSRSHNHPMIFFFFGFLPEVLLQASTSLPTWCGNLLLVKVTLPVAWSSFVGSRGRRTHGGSGGTSAQEDKQGQKKLIPRGRL